MNIISDTHYENFVRKAELNKKIVRIPTDGELEDNGFSITDLYYLVLPNGLTVNPETVNPEIFEDEFKEIFLTKEPVITSTSINSNPSRVKNCEACNKYIPIEHFRKRPGRGSLRRNVCVYCEESAKQNITESLSKDQIHVVDGKSGYIKRYVAYEDVIQLVNEAYQRGKEEGNVNTVHPSLDEMLGIGA